MKLESQKKEKNDLFGIRAGLGVESSRSTGKPSPLQTFSESSKSRKPTSLLNTPEAETDEVLDSLRLRITHMFKWAAEVAGFEFYSPLDQKALMRRTVVELVMLGFAKASTGVDGMLLLGGTGKAIRPSHDNPGIAAVVRTTLVRLVTPLKVLNISDKELKLLKEIVLFNPGMYD
jgi:hypothetical protein